MVKRKFGSSVRAKTLPAQVNEVLLKCLCHNLSVLVHAIHEFGLEPSFWSRMGCVVMPNPRRDLTLAEQANVHALLRVLHAKFGRQWQSVSRALPVAQSALTATMSGRTEVSVTIAFRVAKLMGVSIYDVINGTALPPGVCKHCGMPTDG